MSGAWVVCTPSAQQNAPHGGTDYLLGPETGEGWPAGAQMALAQNGFPSLLLFLTPPFFNNFVFSPPLSPNPTHHWIYTFWGLSGVQKGSTQKKEEKSRVFPSFCVFTSKGGGPISKGSPKRSKETSSDFSSTKKTQPPLFPHVVLHARGP